MKPARESSCLPDGVPAQHRVAVLVRIAGTTFAKLEREERIATGSVSAAAAGRTYAYPRLRAAIVRHLADRLDASEEELSVYLFGP